MLLTLGLLLSTTVAALPGLVKDALAPQGKLPDPGRHALRLMEFYNAPENLGEAANQIKRRTEASARDAEAECIVAGAQCCTNPSGEGFCVGDFSCDNDACVATVADVADAVDVAEDEQAVADEDLSPEEKAAATLAAAEKAAAEAAAAAAVAAEKARAEAEQKRKDKAAETEAATADAAAEANEKRKTDAESAEDVTDAATAAHDEAERAMSEAADKKAKEDAKVKDAMEEKTDAEDERKVAEAERVEEEEARKAEEAAGKETLSPAIAQAHDVAEAAAKAAKEAHDAAEAASEDANAERKAAMGVDEDEQEQEQEQEQEGEEQVPEAIKQHDEAVAAQKEAEEAQESAQENAPKEKYANATEAAKAAHDDAVKTAAGINEANQAAAKKAKEREEKKKKATEKEAERLVRGDPWPTFAPQHPSGDKHYKSGWSLNALTALLHRGVASNNLASVGLAIHCFDGTENYYEPWKPCKVSKKDHCPQGGAWWSASIINEKQRFTIGFGGIVLAPNNKLTKVECSWDSDMGSEAGGCARPAVHDPFPADKLKDMLEKSMGRTVTAAGRVGMYNEVVIDAAHYEHHLPNSVAAFVYFNDTVSGLGGDSNVADKIVTTNAYLAMIDAYNYTEADVPLLQVDREDGLVLDVSLGARQFAETHTLQQYRESHPEEAKRMPRRYKFDAAAAGSKKVHADEQQQRQQQQQQQGQQQQQQQQQGQQQQQAER
jgi:hypothetical protein